jgi:S1-C subfamily serine protease
MRRVALLVGVWALLGSPAALADDAVGGSVVKVTATQRHPDPIRPWMRQPARDVGGSGVVIEGKRILTNAHIVLYASQVFVQPDRSSEKLAATVEALAPGIDLAVLKLEDAAFFETHKPLPMRRDLPKVQDAVAVYGYPEGGTDLSVTKGVVSRVEYGDFQFLARGLRVQVDAAINPGNSGGLAVSGGDIVGLAFSRLGGSDNIGYIIPVEEVEGFLRDVKDGTYDGKPVFDDEVQTLENGTLRARLGLDAKTTGVLVRRTTGDPGTTPLKAGDVITHVGDQSVDNTGRVRIDDGRLIDFRYLAERDARENKTGLTVWRDGKVVKVEVPVAPGRQTWLIPYLKGGLPSYFVYGPMVFTEATDDLVNTVARFMPGSWVGLAFQGNPLVTRYGDHPAFPGERIVVVSHPMFPHRIGQGYKNPFLLAVDEVNGVRVRNLRHLVETLRDAKGEYVEFTFHGQRTDKYVFRRPEALAATEEVLSDNGVRRQCSEDIAPVWGKPK